MKLKFQLVSLFILTALVAFASSFFTERQKELDLELSNLSGTWKAVDVEGFDYTTASYNFKDSHFKLLRPGLIEVELPTKDLTYAVYEKDGNLLYYTEAHPSCVCPKDIDDLLPEVKWGAPKSEEYLYSAERRVTRVLLRLEPEQEE